MIRHKRPASRFYSKLIVLGLSLAFLAGRPAAASDPREELISLLKGANVDGYLFSMSEHEAQASSSLTNKAADVVYTFGRDETGLILRYTSVEDKAAQKTSVYKSEIVKKGTALTLVVTDLETNRAITTADLPAAGPACQPAGQFDSLNACIAQFRCMNGGALLCTANATCQPQFAALTCCLKNGQAFSVHLIFNPTSLRCQFGVLTPEVLGLSQAAF